MAANCPDLGHSPQNTVANRLVTESLAPLSRTRAKTTYQNQNNTHHRVGPRALPTCHGGQPSRPRALPARSRESEDVANPGNNLYVIGLSTRVIENQLEKYFSGEGKVIECHLVTDPYSKESRGFGFVTMETNEDAERCINYLNRSVLEGRLITMEMVLLSKANRYNALHIALNDLQFFFLLFHLSSSHLQKVA
ncbi:hypothetical protein NMG60_11019112 [Bertholletia excelsa]